MEEIGKVVVKSINIFGHNITFNPEMLIMTWLVMIVILLLCFFATRKLAVIPTKIQSVFEIIIEFLKDVLESTLGKKDAPKFTPLIISIFVFVLVSNWIGIIPNILNFIGVLIAIIHKLFGGQVIIIKKSLTNIFISPPIGIWYDFLFKLPAIKEPTKFLSTDLSLALVIFFVVHINSIKSKGIGNYFKSYMEPLPSEGIWLYLFFLNPFFYLNVISQLANTLSHAFRLFGNIFGGGIIIVIVSELLRYFLLPVGLFAFFGLFSGAIQAFVFTMLAISYIAQQK
jgi:F-type H+-transporting ATPase subunit a